VKPVTSQEEVRSGALLFPTFFFCGFSRVCGTQDDEFADQGSSARFSNTEKSMRASMDDDEFIGATQNEQRPHVAEPKISVRNVEAPQRGTCFEILPNYD
jgi:hypothetical protein